ncbi:hypothetical protein MC885_014644 [Smutsia gigantea]|nr:hypothetical protein MC885_014644 [Smutsia gigantea]
MAPNGEEANSQLQLNDCNSEPSPTPSTRTHCPLLKAASDPLHMALPGPNAPKFYANDGNNRRNVERWDRGERKVRKRESTAGGVEGILPRDLRGCEISEAVQVSLEPGNPTIDNWLHPGSQESIWEAAQ